MVQSHGNEPADELEVMQVIRVDKRGWINLQTIVVLIGVLE